MNLTCLILPTAFLLDLLIGDPPRFPHPIRWMGMAIEKAEPRFRKLPGHPILTGGLMAVCLIAATFLVSHLIIHAARWLNPFAGFVIQAVLIFYCLSVRSLQQAALLVLQALQAHDLNDARNKVGMIVGREVHNLDETGVTRAAIETVAENLVDGVFSPLFFAALGGAPLALAYKMVNTLDSMIGYKNDRYLSFGKVAARIDDICNFAPARLSVSAITLAARLLYGKGKAAFQTGWKEGRCHASPNAGYSEAAFAGALSIRLGGPNVYHGRLVEKPFIGKPFGPPSVGQISDACWLMITAAWIGLFFFWGVFLLRIWV